MRARGKAREEEEIVAVNKILGGRPPLVIPDSDLDRLGEDLLSWLNGKEGAKAIFFQDWYFDKHGFSRSDWTGLTDRKGFRPYYEIARLRMARNMMHGQIDKGFTHRYLGLYDDVLHQHEESVKDRDAARKNTSETDTSKMAENIARLLEFSRSFRSPTPSESKASVESHTESLDMDGQASAQTP